MSQNSTLDILLRKYQEAKEQTEYAYAVMQSSWAERQKAREEMNQAYVRMEQNGASFNTIRKQCRGLHNYNNHRIEVLRHRAKYTGNSSDIEAEIEVLLQEMRDADAEAKKRITKNYKTAYYRAKRAFEKARVRHEDSVMEYEYYKAIRDKYKAEYDQAKAEYDEKENQPPKTI